MTDCVHDWVSSGESFATSDRIHIAMCTRCLAIDERYPQSRGLRIDIDGAIAQYRRRGLEGQAIATEIVRDLMVKRGEPPAPRVLPAITKGSPMSDDHDVPLDQLDPRLQQGLADADRFIADVEARNDGKPRANEVLRERGGREMMTPGPAIDQRVARDYIYWNDPAPADFKPSRDWASAGQVVNFMQDLGSSVLLNYGEDTHAWECSWITGGERFTGVARTAQMAICKALLSAPPRRQVVMDQINHAVATVRSKLPTLAEYNRQRYEQEAAPAAPGIGIICDKCGTELRSGRAPTKHEGVVGLDIAPGFRGAHCPCCGTNQYVRA